MLFALEEALRDVWQVLIAHNPYLTREADSELQTAVAETLIDLADSGIRDPDELRGGPDASKFVTRAPPLTDLLFSRPGGSSRALS